jgi:glycosyltransferase involved in cell wall biosynthesis
MKEKLRIGFLTILDPNDKKSWSGTHYRMLKSLEAEFDEVHIIGPIIRNKFIKYLLAGIDRIHKALFNKRYNKDQNFLISIYNTFQIRNKINNVDVIFSPASSTLLPFLNTNIPICTFEDATFNLLLDYYPGYSNFSKLSIIESKYIFRKAIRKAKISVYCSQWAVDNSIKSYGGIEDTDVFMVKLGANIDSSPKREEVLNKEYSSTINLLFLGKDWNRKGGDIVVDVYYSLLKEGMDVSLTVCGCIPPKEYPGVKVVPFLNKNLAKDLDTFNKILLDSHLLFVPTRQECYGIVFCEAAAYGMPVITTATGGVTSVVENGVNGFTLDYDAQANEYAAKIKLLLNDPILMKKMALDSREKFEKELNWGVWGAKMRKILINAVK